jgi:hypothetical protein
LVVVCSFLPAQAQQQASLKCAVVTVQRDMEVIFCSRRDRLLAMMAMAGQCTLLVVTARTQLVAQSQLLAAVVSLRADLLLFKVGPENLGVVALSRLPLGTALVLVVLFLFLRARLPQVKAARFR